MLEMNSSLPSQTSKLFLVKYETFVQILYFDILDDAMNYDKFLLTLSVIMHCDP